MKKNTDTMIAIISLAIILLFVALAEAGQCAWNPGRAYKTGYCVWPREEYIPEEPEKPEDEQAGLVYLGRFWVTGYDACMDCCGKTDGITASGTAAAVGATCAADMPFGTILYIDGIGVRRVEDRGVSGDCVDVFCADHAACYAITGWYDVWEVTA